MTVLVSPWTRRRSGLIWRKVPVSAISARGEVRQGLIDVGEAEVDVGGEREGVHRLRQHLPLLRGGDDDRLEQLGSAAKLLDDGSQLDRLGPGAENDGDAVLRRAG